MPSPPRLEVLAQPFGDRALGEVLGSELREGDWETFRAVVAFLKQSGFRHVAAPLDSFLDRVDSEVVIAVGIDHDGTSLEGLQDLWRLMHDRGELFVFKEGQGGPSRTFHPKAYLFERAEEALALIGSGNLTAGGLFVNHELTVSIALDLNHAESVAFHTDLRSAIDEWQRSGPACRLVDASLLQALVEEGELISEATIAAGARAARTRTRRGSAVHTAGRPVLFSASGAAKLAPAPPPLPPMAAPAVTPPSRPTRAGATRRRARLAATAAAGAAPQVLHQALLIEVRPHHNGEVFLSKTAVDDDPGFFGFPFTGWTTPKIATNPPYPMASPDPQVEIIVYDARGRQVVRVEHSLNVVYYTPKSEIRITIPPEPLARIPQMSLLAMTRNPSASFDYRLDFYPPNCNTRSVRGLRAKLTRSLPSGGAAQRRRYGWA
jgi:HKD family nuclease